MLYKRQEISDYEEFENMLNGIKEKYKLVQNILGPSLNEVSDFYEGNSIMNKLQLTFLSLKIEIQIWEGGDELFNKFDLILKDFYENGASCKSIENKWFNKRFTSKPILRLMLYKYDKEIEKCLFSELETPVSERKRIGDIDSIKLKISQRHGLLCYSLTKNIFKFYRDNKFRFGIKSEYELYEWLYAMDKLEPLTKKLLEENLEFPAIKTFGWNQEEFNKYLEKKKKSPIDKLLYEKVRKLFE